MPKGFRLPINKANGIDRDILTGRYTARQLASRHHASEQTVRSRARALDRVLRKTPLRSEELFSTVSRWDPEEDGRLVNQGVLETCNRFKLIYVVHDGKETFRRG